ncbi:meprin A subunit alpha-like [Lissotriton helveticus]
MEFLLLVCVFALDLTHTTGFTVRRSSLDSVYDVGGGQPTRDIPEINAESGKRLFEGDIVLLREKNAVTDHSKRWKFPIPYILADNLGNYCISIVLSHISYLPPSRYYVFT